MKITIRIPGLVKYWLRLKKAELMYKMMKINRISDLKVGDKLYRISESTGKLLTYTIEKIDGSWFSLSNETGYICTAIQCHDIDKGSLNGIFYTHQFMAAWAAIRNIRDEQYKLEQKRIQIIKVNGIKVKINTYPEKDGLIKRTINNIKKIFNNK